MSELDLSWLDDIRPASVTTPKSHSRKYWSGDIAHLKNVIKNAAELADEIHVSLGKVDFAEVAHAHATTEDLLSMLQSGYVGEDKNFDCGGKTVSEPDYKLWAIFVRFMTEIVDYAVMEGVESKEAFKQVVADLKQKIEEANEKAVAAHGKATKLKKERYCEECGKPADAPDPHVCKECYHKIWDLHCLSCGWNCSLADYGHEITKTGDTIRIFCPSCHAAWWKIVGEEHGVKVIRDRLDKAWEASQ